METSLTTFLIISGAGLAAGSLLLFFRLREKRRLAFVLTGTALGLALGYLMAKLLYIAGTLFYPLSIHGAAAVIRLEASEFSFFGGCLGYVLGLMAAARMTGINRREMLDRFALPGCIIIAAIRFATLYLSEIGLGEFQTVGFAAVEDGSVAAFFPLAVRDNWGGWWLAVSTLECLAALCCGIYAWRRQDAWAGTPGGLFTRTAVLLCSAQMFLELMHSLSTITYFVHTEQVYCALYILIVTILAARTIARKQPGAHAWKWVVFAVLWIALNSIVQFMLDKPYDFLALLPEDAGNWVADRLAPIGYGLILISTIGLCVNALKACRHADKR